MSDKGTEIDIEVAGGAIVLGFAIIAAVIGHIYGAAIGWLIIGAGLLALGIIASIRGR